ncbi:hypothetical protein B9Z19DRAFT_1080119 [Tuber borchii]|uniref:Secreted protein n=1 Tax=Tuber borchii TaxID=42251 RepID=A0A2T6ZXC6_TUBBO|nr:hypothetical protein B9Z19DRAFT_1080119 [Tuber borchii]
MFGISAMALLFVIGFLSVCIDSPPQRYSRMVPLLFSSVVTNVFSPLSDSRRPIYSLKCQLLLNSLLKMHNTQCCDRARERKKPCYSSTTHFTVH